MSSATRTDRDGGKWGKGMTSIAQDDTNAVVIIGSGAGGGTLAHELTRRGIKVVLLEAGRASVARELLAGSRRGLRAAHLARTAHSVRIDHRRRGLSDPAILDRQDGRRHDRALDRAWPCVPSPGRCAPAPPTATSTALRSSTGRWSYDELLRYYQLAEQRMVVTRRNGNPGLPASNHFKVMSLRGQAPGLQAGAYRLHGDQFASRRRSRHVHPAGLLRAGMQDRRQVEHALHRDPARRGDRQSRSAARMPRRAHRARRRWPRQRGGLSRSGRQRATPEGPRRLRRLQLRRDLALAAAVGVGQISATGSRTPAIRSAAISAITPAASSGACSTSRSNSGAARRSPAWCSMRPGTIPKRGFAGGYHLEMAALDSAEHRDRRLAADALGTRARLRHGSLPQHGRDLSSTVRTCRAQTNRITLNPAVKDPFGLPVANIHVDDHPNNAAMRRHGQQQAKAMFEAAGAIKVRDVDDRRRPRTTCARRA